MIETIPPALAGERLDRVLAMVAGITRSKASTLVSDGAVQVNAVVVTSGTHRLAEDDVIEVELPEAAGPTVLVPAPEVDLEIIYEDDDLLIVNKQPGLVVHPGAGNWTGTLAQAVLARYPEIAQVGDPERPGIVHRLDRDTSGLMVVARSDLAYEGLVAMMGARDVDRRYRTLVWGTLDNTSGMIEAPIGRSSRDPTKMAVSARGREARTRYEVDRSFREPAPVALLTCKLDTGRTHQIRVHASAIGHPVVGDERYGGLKPAIDTPRMFLHAAELGFTHPRTGDQLSFEAPLPADLAAVLATLS